MYKVLLIDDEKILCLSMQVKVGQALKGMAHECRYALTGEAGIQESRTWKPDIAIVDFCLPDMIGNEVVRRIHEVSPDTLLIGLSAHDNYEYVRSMFIEGSFDYLLKPVPAAELKKRLRKAIQMIDTRRQLLTHEKHSELAEVICRAERMEKAAFTSALLQSGEWKKIYPYSSYSVARVAGRWDAQVRPEEIHPLLCESEEAVWQLLPCRYGDMIIILNAEKPEDSFQRMLKDFAVKAHAELYLGASEGAFMGIGGLHTALLHARRARIAHLLDEQDRVVRYLPAFGRSEHPAWNISDQRLSAPQERQNVLGRLLKLFESKEEFAKEIAALSPCEFESMYLGVLAIIHRCPIEAERDCTEHLRPLVGFGTMEEVRSYLQDTLSRICQSDFRKAESQSVQKAAAYIREHYAEPISVKMLADQCYMNYTYFSELFKKETGISITQYIMDIRMSHAMQLLRERSFSLEDVALAVGYGNAKSFSQAFRNYFGVSPKKYTGNH